LKCPKCGFNSFEYYDICKKCSADLTVYKQTYSINALLLPLEAKEKYAAEYKDAESSAVEDTEINESHEDIFSFDLPDDSPANVTGQSDDPFNFDEPVPENQSGGSRSENDIFADLLESTSQSESASVAVQPLAAPATGLVSPQSSGAGEFDVDSFSWDETPADSSGSVTPDAADDFDSLFGDTKDTPAK
jgi:hypothetical protein